MSAERVREYYRKQGRVTEREELIKILQAEIERVPNTLYREGLREAIRVIEDRFKYADQKPNGKA
jgi:hypothetical protein